MSRDGAVGSSDDIGALAKGGRTNMTGFAIRLIARLPFLLVAGRLYGPSAVGRYAIAVVVVELAALLATVGLRRGLAQALAGARSKEDEAHIVWDAMLLALIASLIAGGVLFVLPFVMYPDGVNSGLERWFAWIVIAIAWSDVSLAALACRHNVKASVTARAIVEPWTISIAVFVYHYVAPDDGLTLAYVTALSAAMVASVVPMVRSYGWPRGWRPDVGRTWELARRNAPLAGAEAVEWGSRNIDRFILGLMFEPRFVGIYYMAQQIASVAQKLKTSFDPILGPVLTSALARDDRKAVAHQVRQVGFWVMSAQAVIALMGSIPGKAWMGLMGPQFVSGTAALGFLLWGEVLAAQGAVSESALVYLARMRNLLISIAMLLFQVLLSVGLVLAARAIDLPVNYQAAGPALALMLSLWATSLVKAGLLSRMVGERVSGWRWPFVVAMAAAVAVGSIFTSLPHQFEWTELVLGVPAIAAAYGFVLWRWAFKAEDRALFQKLPAAEPEVA